MNSADRPRIRSNRNPIRQNPGTIGLTRQKVAFRIFFNVFCVSSGVVRESFGGRSGVVRGRSGVVRGSFRGCSAVVQDSFETFSKVFRKSPFPHYLREPAFTG